MRLVTLLADRIAFNKAAITRRPYEIGHAIAQRARTLPVVTKEDREFRLMLLIRDEINVFECSIEEAEQAFNPIDSEREGATA